MTWICNIYSPAASFSSSVACVSNIKFHWTFPQTWRTFYQNYLLCIINVCLSLSSTYQYKRQVSWFIYLSILNHFDSLKRSLKTFFFSEFDRMQYFYWLKYLLNCRAITRQGEEDEYIQTYKVGKKKQDLDRLVLKGMKKFSIIGVWHQKCSNKWNYYILIWTSYIGSDIRK